MKIVIFGGNGFLGTKLKYLLSKNGHTILSADNKNASEFKIDATNIIDVNIFLKKEMPDLIIDAIALTSSFECEKNPTKAEILNYQTAKNISDVAKKINVKMIFISSSYIFDGKDGEYTECSVPTPQGIYGITKLKAEKELLKENNNIIFRVDLLYGYNSKNKPNGIFDKILSNKNVFIGNPNQIRSPLFIDDISNIIEKLYLSDKSGIFNLAGPDRIKMIDFLIKLENLLRDDSKVHLIKNKKLLVPERKNSSLNANKIKNIGIKLKNLKEGLKLIKKELK